MATSLPGPQRQPLQQFMPRTELTMQQAVRAQSGAVRSQGQIVVGGDLAQQQVVANSVQGQAGAMPQGMNGVMPQGWFQSVFGAIGSLQDGQSNLMLGNAPLATSSGGGTAAIAGAFVGPNAGQIPGLLVGGLSGLVFAQAGPVVPRAPGGGQAGGGNSDCGALLWEKEHVQVVMGGLTIYVTFQRYERCVRWIFEDTGTSTDAELDLTATLGNATTGPVDILVFNTPSAGTLVHPGVFHFGEFKNIIARGPCTPITFLQFKRISTVRYDKDGNVIDRTTGEWHLDGGVPYPGQFQDPVAVSTGDQTFHGDHPGGAPSGIKPKGRNPAGTAKVEETREYLTFFVCRKQIIGAIYWGVSFTWWTNDDGSLAGPGVSTIKPRVVTSSSQGLGDAAAWEMTKDVTQSRTFTGPQTDPFPPGAK